MNSTVNCVVNSTILAVDLGQFNSVLCRSEPVSRTASFRTVKTPPELLRREPLRLPLAWVGFHAGWIHELCEELALTQ